MFKKALFLLFFAVNILNISAQQYEIGIQVGGTKYIGDIGKEDYFYPSDIGGSLIFKNTINPWMLMRLSFSYFPTSAYDNESYNLGRQTRNWSFTNNIMEVSMGIEYNFIPRNPFLRGRKHNRFTPYMFTGMSLSNYFGKLYQNGNPDNAYEFNGIAMGIPMIVGFKYKLSEHWLFSSEIGARYNFSDNLDGSQKYSEHIDHYTIYPTTNRQSNDWYTFTSFGLIYTFGDLRCYFGF